MTGRSDDMNRFIATLTSIQALKLTKTERDIVVMVPPNFSPQNAQILTKNGAKIHMIKDEDLFSSHRKSNPSQLQDLPLGSECYSNFAPIYVFTLEQYDRVIWLDADVLPQLNMDEFFLCGEFCMTYANLQWYIASVFVAKPSRDKFTQLYNNISQNIKVANELKSISSRWFPTPSSCQTVFEEYLLQSFYHLESAPLFNPQGNGQQTTPLMRL
jgi:alpha-N-acetylglucosamine transferase